jgi:hypothetical protein
MKVYSRQSKCRLITLASCKNKPGPIWAQGGNLTRLTRELQSKASGQGNGCGLWACVISLRSLDMEFCPISTILSSQHKVDPVSSHVEHPFERPEPTKEDTNQRDKGKCIPLKPRCLACGYREASAWASLDLLTWPGS